MTSPLSRASSVGFQVPTCTNCNHPVGDHQSAGTRWPHPPRYGLCRHDGCDCQQYVDPDDDLPKAA
jgi:hypothetical protein